MAKPSALNPDALPTAPRGGLKQESSQPKPMPLQVRWPREEVKAVKVAAAQAEQTVSEFMLACFHAFNEKRK